MMNRGDRRIVCESSTGSPVSTQIQLRPNFKSLMFNKAFLDRAGAFKAVSKHKSDCCQNVQDSLNFQLVPCGR